MKFVWPLLLACLTITSCISEAPRSDSQHPADARRDGLPQSIGAQGELMVVMDDANWNGGLGEAFRELVNTPYLLLPQAEPQFEVNRQNHEFFYKFFKQHRHIMMFDVGDRLQNQEPSIKVQKDIYARDQMIFTVYAKDIVAFRQVLEEFGPSMLYQMTESELARIGQLARYSPNHGAADSLCQEWGVCLEIPSNFTLVEDTTDFKLYRMGVMRTNPELQQAIAVYRYPYTNDSTFTATTLLAARDSVMKRYIGGSQFDSYMTTEYFYAPRYRELDLNGRYATELKGLWKLQGEFSGGPFVSLTYLDEVNQMVITTEGFVFAPHEEKREHMRFLEGILRTAHISAGSGS